MDIVTSRLLRWEGALPQGGDYLKTHVGSYYRIIDFIPTRGVNPRSVGRLGLLKIPSEEIDDIKPDAIIHNFRWSGRNKR